MKNILLPLLLALALTANGQIYKSKFDSIYTSYQVKRGERAFDNMRYLKTTKICQPIFLRNALNNKSKGILAQAYIYVAVNDMALQVLQSMDTATMLPADVYNTAQALKLNGLYDESDEWMERFQRLQSSDSRPKWQSNSAAEVEKIIAVERYYIECMDFNSSQSDFSAVQYQNEVVFASARKVDEVLARQYGWKETPYLNVFKVADSAGVFNAPKIFSSKLKTVYHDGPVSFSADGNEMFVTQNPYSFPGKIGKKQINHFQLLIANKTSDGTWSNLTPVAFNGTDFSTGHASLSHDGNTLWFASDRAGGVGKSDIFYVKRTNGSWGEPVNAGPTINTEGDEMFPFAASNGNLYFSSTGHLTLGGLDVCIAFNTSSGYKVRNMGHPINSPSDDFALFMNPQNNGGYFASNRTGGVGDDDIYLFEVLKPVVLNRQLVINVVDKKTLLPIHGCELLVMMGSETATLMSDSVGSSALSISDVDLVNLSANATGYEPVKSAVEITFDSNVYQLFMQQIPIWGVFGKITDLGTGLGVDSINVLLQPLDQPNSITNITLNGGTFKNQLLPETDYAVTLSSSNYFVKKGAFSTKGRVPGWININEFMTATIEKIEMNKVIEIPNIYYDLGKYNIRKDASVELDKVVAFLVENPTIIIELGSHTDSRGNATSNQTLAQKRAQSAVDYIVKKGINTARISAKGYGESVLKNHCADGVTCSENEHQQNRRTEIMVVGVR